MKYSAPINQHTFLNQLRQQAAQQLLHAETIYQKLPAATLNAPAANSGWSILQCLQHLNTYGAYYLPAIERAIQNYNGKPAETVKIGWLGNYFIKMIDPDLTTAKYKAAKMHLPAEQPDANEVLDTFISQQKQLIGLIEQAANVNLNTIRIPISIFKMINMRLGATLMFLVAHNERHIRQANVLL